MSAITRQQLNAVVQALGAKDRPAAVAILGRFGVLTTAKLPTEHWQAVFDECTEALSKLDASTTP